MIPPRLVLEVGGTSALQAAVPGELKSPPTWNLEVGGTSTLQAQLPARLKSPPLQAQVWGGSRWADLAVCCMYLYPFIELFLSFSKHVAKVQRCDYLPLQKVVGAAAHNDEVNCAGGVSAVVTHAVLQ